MRSRPTRGGVYSFGLEMLGVDLTRVLMICSPVRLAGRPSHTHTLEGTKVRSLSANFCGRKCLFTFCFAKRPIVFTQVKLNNYSTCSNPMMCISHWSRAPERSVILIRERERERPTGLMRFCERNELDVSSGETSIKRRKNHGVPPFICKPQRLT